MSRKMVVVDYNPEWAKLYKEETKKIKAVLGKNCVGFYHIGSTAVKGMKARPIIDIMALVKNVDKIETCVEDLEALGYIYQLESEIPEARFFMKIEEEIAYYIYIFKASEKEKRDKHVALRDYLIQHPEEAKAYGELKSKVVKRYAFDEKGYCKGKEAHLKALVEKAEAWGKGKSNKGLSIGMGAAFGACFGLAFGSDILGIPGFGMIAGIVVGALFGATVGIKNIR